MKKDIKNNSAITSTGVKTVCIGREGFLQNKCPKDCFYKRGNSCFLGKVTGVIPLKPALINLSITK